MVIVVILRGGGANTAKFNKGRVKHRGTTVRVRSTNTTLRLGNYKSTLGKVANDLNQSKPRSAGKHQAWNLAAMSSRPVENRGTAMYSEMAAS